MIRARLKPALRRLPGGVFLEGGDVIPFSYDGRRCLLIGYGPRSNEAALDAVRHAFLPELADELIAIRLARGA